jgi:hypothetical protein
MDVLSGGDTGRVVAAGPLTGKPLMPNSRFLGRIQHRVGARSGEAEADRFVGRRSRPLYNSVDFGGEADIP